MSFDTRRSFHQSLADIRDDVVRLAALVCERIPWGTHALLDGDLASAQELIDTDDQLDVLALDIEDRCYHHLALQQPMASDMRAVVTAIRLTSEMERSGDLMANIAKAVRRIHGVPIEPRVRGLLQSMSDEALRLYRDAVDAYVDRDDARAAELPALDDVLDGIHRDYIAELLESCRAGAIDIQPTVQLAVIGRFYERVGDHAVNVGEKVRYMVTGWLPERRATVTSHSQGEP